MAGLPSRRRSTRQPWLSSELTATTDAGGGFALAGLERDASYTVSCRKDGWVCAGVRIKADDAAGTKPLTLLGHAFPSVTISVSDVLTGAPVDGATVSFGTYSAVSSAGQVVFPSVDPAIGQVPGSVTLVGMQPEAFTVRPPTAPPFEESERAFLCPIPPAGAQVYGVDASGQGAVVAMSSVKEDGRLQTRRGVESEGWYSVTPETPVLPLAEVHGALHTGKDRRLLVRGGSVKGRDRDAPAWLLTRVVVAEKGTLTPEMPWKVWSFFQTRPELITAREGGYVGVEMWAYYELWAPGKELGVWNRSQRLSDLTGWSDNAPGFDLVELPSDGLWALIQATGPLPWNIYVVKAGS